jgi:quercetin 2,3-dioxygenase
VWIYPRRVGGAPRHETFRYAPLAKQNRFLLALSPDRRDGSALIGQDAFLSIATFDAGTHARYPMYLEGNGVYVHCVRGTATVAGQRLGPGDAVGVWETNGVDMDAATDAELVLVEVPMTRGVNVG